MAHTREEAKSTGMAYSIFSRLSTPKDLSSDESKMHSVQFTVDFYNFEGKHPTIQDFMKRESDYDLAFCSAMQFAFHPDRLRHFISAESKSTYLSSLLETINDKSLEHRPQRISVYNEEKKLIGYQNVRGRAYTFNYYGLIKDLTADQKGIRDLIEGIISREKHGFNELSVILDDGNARLILDENSFYLLAGNKTKKIDLTKDKIIETILNEFNKGAHPSGYDRCRVFSVKSLAERRHRENALFTQFLESIKLAETNEDKTKNIAKLCRELFQLHLYYDGNGRSLYIFANLLCQMNGLDLFYPNNMCLFAGNSIDNLLREIIEGQKRFKAMFGTKDDLTSGLETYRNLILELKQLIKTSGLAEKDITTLNGTLERRDLNLLLRQAATSTKITVLKFLVAHAQNLNINIREKGKTSGKDALDIAREQHNTAAIEILSPYWLTATTVAPESEVKIQVAIELKEEASSSTKYTPEKLHPASTSFLKMFNDTVEFKEEKINEEVIGSKIHPAYR